MAAVACIFTIGEGTSLQPPITLRGTVSILQTDCVKMEEVSSEKCGRKTQLIVYEILPQSPRGCSGPRFLKLRPGLLPSRAEPDIEDCRHRGTPDIFHRPSD